MALSDRYGKDRPGLRVSQVIDHSMIDAHGRRAGRVDDVLLEFTRPGEQGSRLVLTAIVSGPMARPTWRPIQAVARWCYRLLGVANPCPTVLDWRHVAGIDALVHLDVDADEAGLRKVDDAVRRRIPGKPHDKESAKQ